jgi:uncharacterized membrane protein (UPF0182 family)
VEKNPIRKYSGLALLGAVAILLLFGLSDTGLAIVTWLWMGELGYEEIYWRILSLQAGVFGPTLVIVFIYLWLNLRIGLNNCGISFQQGKGAELVRYHPKIEIPAAWPRIGLVLLPVLAALIFALVLYPFWDTCLRFFWGGDFGQADPIYGRDLGFYVFRLPFYQFLQNSFTGLTLGALLLLAIIYGFAGVFADGGRQGPAGRERAVRHLTGLTLFVLIAWGWGFYLDRFELLYSSRGVVYGAGYTDANITRISLWVMLFATAALGVLLLSNRNGRRPGLVLAGGGAYIFLYILVILVIPGLVQKFLVEPSELELELPYLTYNIDFTRRAYRLDRIEGRTYPALGDLTYDEIYHQKNQETIDNVRLWDWRPLLQAYRQTQEIRLYYEFYKVDVGRYHLADGYHQVMLSARELAPTLPEKAQTWVNERLQFTHGYGLAMNFVSKSAEGGFPAYIIENVPPELKYDLKLDQPAIYYGEKTPGYRIVNTAVKEFDYPKGSENVYAGYQGSGGIFLDSWWKRILFAWTQSDINILLTSYLEPGSRIQIWRQVQERVGKVAPFLRLDNDPYLVLSGGKLFWIQDAYTTTNRFPYSEPYGQTFGQQLNYLRNSVKVVVDVYNGSVQFFVTDPEDPVLMVYRQAFPGVFKPLSELSADLKAHLRYPEDLFLIQADLYRTYHMTDPQVFYNREDLWTLPQEKYAGTAVPMIPYYILMRLPGSEELEYLLMIPFTPQNRDNMIGWMAAKCDFPQYGKVLVYDLPKEKLTLGPIQVEAIIDQNTLISEQLSLWDQRGSRVIRGNLVVLPLDNAFLYVEPVYLTAEGTEIPQLKRVIAVAGNKVAMEPTLREAIKAVFGASRPEKVKVAAPPGLEVLSAARDKLAAARKAMQQGNWQDFGEALHALEKLLGQQPPAPVPKGDEMPH